MTPTIKPQPTYKPSSGFTFPGPVAAPPLAAADSGHFSTVNLEDLSGLGVSQKAPLSDAEASIADAILHLNFEGDTGAMELGGILDDATYTSLEGINTAEFSQLLHQGPGAVALPDTHGTLLTYPESITRLVSQRRAEGEPGGDSGGSNLANGLMGPIPGEDNFSSIVDLDFNSLLNQLNS